MKIKAYIRIIRPVNVLITFISIIVAAFICSGRIELTGIVFFAAISGALTAAAGNIINDIFDIRTDKINHPGRPLAANIIKPKEAASLYLLLIAVSLAISHLISIQAFCINLFASLLLYLYSFKLKSTVLAGNFVVAFLTGLAFIYGGIAVGNIYNSFMPAVFAFLINVVREIVKDMEDVDGDIAAGITTFPSLYGFRLSKIVIIIFSFILIASTFIPFVFKFYNIEYFTIVMVIVNPLIVYSVNSITRDDKRKNLNKLSFILKLDMLFGLIAIYLGR